ncbi:MAG: gephyrin-like molybdotransferase Glp [Actinomycetota bacterium]
MIPLDEAQTHVVDRCPPLPVVSVSLREARGLVTAEGVTSPEQIPPFDNTAVDGFAVRAADTEPAGAEGDGRSVSLAIVGTIAAGAAPTVPVESGQAIRIMTGAPMPDGADSVAMVEWTSVEGETVTIDRSVSAGDAVRHAGEDLEPGDPVFEPGTELTPGHLGVLASIGRYDVKVGKRPKVGVFSTGDELIEGPQQLQPGQIRDSNRHTLIALAERDGFEVVDLGMIPDDEEAIEAAVRSGAADCDALLTSGGVSMGDYDYVKAVLSRIADMRWMQVAIKPAKPFAFGLMGDTPVFGLPGNTVSSMVSYEMFARPGLRSMMGHSDLHRPRVAGVAGQDWRRGPDGKTHFVRVRIEGSGGEYAVVSAGGQGSHQLTAMAGADALAIVPDGDGFAQGDPMQFFWLT